MATVAVVGEAMGMFSLPPERFLFRVIFLKSSYMLHLIIKIENSHVTQRQHVEGSYFMTSEFCFEAFLPQTRTCFVFC